MPVKRPTKSVGNRWVPPTKKKPLVEQRPKTTKRAHHNKAGTKGGKKPPIFTVAQMMEHMRKKVIPTMVQHCILKVYPKISGGRRGKFHGAYNICVATFGKYGYLKNRSITKTGKGQLRYRLHQRERMRGRKRRMYENMVDKLFGPQIAKLSESKAREEYER